MKVKKQGWINIYQGPSKKENKRRFVFFGEVYSTKEKALSIVEGDSALYRLRHLYITTIQIEWEEEV